MGKLDLIDRRIPGELTRDASQPIGHVAERVGLSQTPCWKRIQRLEKGGVIAGRVALVDPARVGRSPATPANSSSPMRCPQAKASVSKAPAWTTASTPARCWEW